MTSINLVEPGTIISPFVPAAAQCASLKFVFWANSRLMLFVLLSQLNPVCLMTDHASDVRRSLLNPRELCDRLGLSKGCKTNGDGVIIRCPWHEDRTASCSVKLGTDGTIFARCFSCGATGDALTLIANVYNLNLTSEFKEVLAMGAEIAGNLALAEENATVTSIRTCHVARSQCPHVNQSGCIPMQSRLKTFGNRAGRLTTLAHVTNTFAVERLIQR